VVYRKRPPGSISAAYGGRVTSRSAAGSKAMKTRGGFMGTAFRAAGSFVKRRAVSALKTKMSEDDIKVVEQIMSAANQAIPATFDLKGTAINIGVAALSSPRVQKMMGEAVQGATDYALKKGKGIATGVFKQIEVQPAVGGNAKDVRVASTSVHRMMSGTSATEKPVGIVFFHLGRRQSAYIRKVKNLFSTSTKFYTYQSVLANYRFYTSGLNSKGVYWGGNSLGDNKIQAVLSTSTLQANFNALNLTTVLAEQGSGDRYPSLNFTTYDDIFALYQTIPVGSPIIVDTDTGVNAGQDIRFPMESKRLEFEITNLNKYLNGHFEIYRLVAKTDISGGASSPENLWYQGLTHGPGTVGTTTDTGYLGNFARIDPTNIATSYNAGFDLNLKATPGLSAIFKQFWSIEEVRKMIIQPDQTVKVVFNETMSNGISLDEITRRIRSNTAIAAGGAHFMIVMRTNPLYVERSAKSSGDPTNVAYNIIAESGFLNYKVSNIKKTYSAHVPRRGDVNQPWQNCLGMAQTTSIILPRYEYASGAFLNSTGTTVGTEGQYTMPLVTPNAVQYGGIKD